MHIGVEADALLAPREIMVEMHRAHLSSQSRW